MAAPKLLKKISRQLALEIVHNAFTLAREGKIDEAVAVLAANNVGPDTFYAGKNVASLNLSSKASKKKLGLPTTNSTLRSSTKLSI